MPSNKYAIVRINTLDRCFRNPGRRYYMKDLLEACNDDLNEHDPTCTGTSERTIYQDLRFMESPEGFSAPIDRIKDGRKTFYRYSDNTFSLAKSPLNETEMMQLKETMSLLSRFEGIEQFEWVEEILTKLDSSFYQRNETGQVIAFDTNPYLKGLSYLKPLFNAIIYKKALSITYQSFSGNPEFTYTLHPYFLKQYNNRWFVFGWDEEQDYLINSALDRVISIEESDHEYIENDDIDFSEYFFDVVGVSVDLRNEPENVILRVNKDLWPRVRTKPIHGSQTIINETDGYVELGYKLIPNRELNAALLAYGEELTVIQPEGLREVIAKKVSRMHELYKKG